MHACVTQDPEIIAENQWCLVADRLCEALLTPIAIALTGVCAVLAGR